MNTEAKSFLSFSDADNDLPLDNDIPDVANDDTPDDVVTDDTSDDVPESVKTDINTDEAPQKPKTNNSYIDSMADDDVQRLAREIGWNPNGKKSAKEWLKGANNYVFKTKDVMDSMQKKLDSIEALNIQREKKIREQERQQFKNLLKNLEKRKIEAVELSDIDTVNDIDEQKDIVKQRLSEYEQEDKQFNNNQTHHNQAEVFQTVKQFVDENPWYETNAIMKVRYDNALQGYLNAGVNINDALIGAKEDLERLYPDKFATKTQTPPRGNVLGTVNNAPKQQSDGLNAEQREVFNYWVSGFKDMFPNATKAQLDAYKKTTIAEIKGR
jgi:hypothetical protein